MPDYMVSALTKSCTLEHIPSDPGVYLMKDETDRILYIGKAKNLKKRVFSYYSSKAQRDANWKTKKLVSRVAEIEFVTTSNEIEAFLLESNLIKRYRPLFNIELKDQQRYTYLKLTQESFPRLLVARRNRRGEFSGPKGKIYGPFVKGSSKVLTVGLLRKLFKIRICNRLPKKPCLEYFIKNCDAPCIKNVTESQYLANVMLLENILNGKNSVADFMKQMEQEMKNYALQQRYERAKDIRDTLRRLENLQAKQNMEKVSRSDEEYIGIIEDETKATAHLIILSRRHGVIMDRRKFDFELVGENSLGTFLLQYYTSVPSIPGRVYVNKEPESKAILEASLEKLCGHEVRIVKIAYDFHDKEKKEIMDLVIRNLHIACRESIDRSVLELKIELGLEKIPNIIDCFDISNLGMTLAVGSRVRFIEGRPRKEGYRRFRIRSTSGQNDFAMMAEIVSRSYSSASNHDQLPDLIVIDGGRGQLSSASTAISRLGLRIMCISIAKEKEEVYTHLYKKPVRLQSSGEAIKLLRHIRDEAHRFGLQYNIKLRSYK